MCIWLFSLRKEATSLFSLYLFYLGLILQIIPMIIYPIKVGEKGNNTAFRIFFSNENWTPGL